MIPVRLAALPVLTQLEDQAVPISAMNSGPGPETTLSLYQHQAVPAHITPFRLLNVKLYNCNGHHLIVGINFPPVFIPFYAQDNFCFSNLE
jgi:hypothetical protein